MRISRLFWAGLILLAIGVTPLLAVTLFSNDPNPNPIGFGLLAFVTFWPAIILIVVGWNRCCETERINASVVPVCCACRPHLLLLQRRDVLS